MDYREMLRVEPGGAFSLSKVDPGFKDRHADKESARAETEKHAQRLRDLQYLLYAENRRSLLIVLQGLDAAGKDGTINHVFHAMNVQGVRASSFKVPSAEELAHDFLWRVHARAPARGEIVIFNRSHYEDVLVVRVHGLVPEEVWRRRYDRIVEFERTLVEGGTRVLKFFLHVSEAEQLRRFEQRLADPERQWKISESDYAERKLFPRYLEAYEEALSKTSTKHAPWFVIPSDHKWFRDLAVSRIVVEELEALDLKLPAPRADLADIRRRYHDAVRAEKKRN
jgi:PPK2 family polyphosphate:nucleotide phosphotransferase